MGEKVERIIVWVNKYILGPALPAAILIAGIILIFRYGILFFIHPLRVIKGLFAGQNSGGISPFKTAMLALASTLGVGNIVGVSTAIAVGGPGAVFWMTVSALLAIPLKYGEVVLAMLYRKRERDEYRGGAMYYMFHGLNNRALSVVFSVLCIINAITVGNIVQINAVSESFSEVFGVSKIWLGAIAAVIIFWSLNKGTKRIVSITSYIIPTVTCFYLAVSFFVLFRNFSRLPSIISLIISAAFKPYSAIGGMCGYSVASAIRYGTARGIMSNEAGSGTSPTAHAKSNNESAVHQGFWGVFEVFTDTVVMCNITAFVILLSFEENVISKGLDGMTLVVEAYGKYLGEGAVVLITLSVGLFAYATIICQGFYGYESLYYLTDKKTAIIWYRVIFGLCVYYGAVGKSSLVWNMTDLNISVMTVINTVCVVFLSGEIRKVTLEYFLKNKKPSKLVRRSKGIT